MHRTTMLLPEALRQEAENVARAQGITLSELFRRKLAGAVSARRSEKRKHDPLFQPAHLMKNEGPGDVSTRHDDYLDGPKFRFPAIAH